MVGTRHRAAIVEHPLSDADRAAAAELRAQTAALPAPPDLASNRASFEAMLARIPLAAGVRYEAAEVGGIAGFWCRSDLDRPGAAILYLHGGAYMIGSANGYRGFAGQLAARSATAAFVAEYRLAPEHPFPAAVEDAGAALLGLAALGYRSIVVAGDSAGGGLSLVTLALARSAARAGVVFSPWTDLALTGDAMTERAAIDPLLDDPTLRNAAREYLAGHDARDPHASPLFGDLADLPPLQLHVGTDEILFDDALRYFERARDAAVDATVHVWDGMPHVFPSQVGTFAASDACLDIASAFIDEHLAASAPGAS